MRAIGTIIIKPKLKLKLNLKPQSGIKRMIAVIMTKLKPKPNLKLNLKATFHIEGCQMTIRIIEPKLKVKPKVA